MEQGTMATPPTQQGAGVGVTTSQHTSQATAGLDQWIQAARAKGLSEDAITAEIARNAKKVQSVAKQRGAELEQERTRAQQLEDQVKALAARQRSMAKQAVAGQFAPTLTDLKVKLSQWSKASQPQASPTPKPTPTAKPNPTKDTVMNIPTQSSVRQGGRVVTTQSTQRVVIPHDLTTADPRYLKLPLEARREVIRRQTEARNRATR